ncbi:MAG: hypothetical protein AB2A00_16850 [Myxococcota bacterium]
MLHKARWNAALAVLALGAAGCPACQNPADTVAMGVARLTVRNMGAVGTLVNANTSCGFSAPSVLGAATLSGEVGTAGSVTWTVTDCEIDAGGGTEVSKDCEGVTVTASGKVKVSATKTITGILTGKPESPVVPSGPDAVTIAITSASFTDFKVENSSSGNKMTIKSGTLAANIKPRLAVAADTGACAISTPNTTFSGITWTSGAVHVTTPDNEVEATIKTSALDAQNGVNGDNENKLSGKITLSSQVGMAPPNQEEEKTIPVSGDTEGLDPDYDAAKFKASYACTANLASPESFVCADLRPRLADGAARLTVKTFGAVAGIVDKNTTCGFSATSVQGAATATGTVGGQGAVTFTVTDCDITIPADTAVSTDCAGVETRAGGTFRVSGTKTVSGRLTGSQTQPVVPSTDSPAVLSLTITPTNFKVSSSADVNALTLVSGTLAGTLTPRVALAADTGACAISTPMARFEDLTYTNGVVKVTSESGTFQLNVGTSTIDAVNGTWDTDSNKLSGSISVEGESFTVPSDLQGLNPDFDQAAFDASYACTPNLVTPVSHSCSFLGPLAQGISRLTPRTLGTVVSIINADTNCGFSSAAVGGTPQITGNLGDDGATAVFTISSACTLPFATETVVGPATSCNPAATSVMGTISVTGTKTVRGYNTGDPLTPIVPTSRDPAEFDLTITFTDFTVTNSESTSSLTVKSGTLSAQVTPRTGIDLTTGACSISTPVVTFESMTFSNANVRLVSDGKAFDVAVSASDLDAQNGTKDTVSNTLTGSITVDSAPVTIPINPADSTLDPEFDQTAFDAAYACTPNLMVAPNEEACSFRRTLAQQAARLLIKNVGVATNMLNGNTSCGFAAASVLGAPTDVQGNPGSPGSITWAANACAMGPLPADTTIAPDCLGGATKASGTATATATKMVTGLRNTDPPIVPVSRDAATFTITSLVFDAFNAYSVPTGVTVPTGKMTLTGTATATVSPIGGESNTNAGVYSISTPVAGLSNVQTTNATAVLFLEGKTFNVTIDSADLDAFAGSYDTQTNTLSGTISVDGRAVTLPINPADPTLDPSYDQTTFDSSYACTPDLKEPVPAAS